MDLLHELTVQFKKNQNFASTIKHLESKSFEIVLHLAGSQFAMDRVPCSQVWGPACILILEEGQLRCQTIYDFSKFTLRLPKYRRLSTQGYYYYIRYDYFFSPS